jgi:hypothetical protein
MAQVKAINTRKVHKVDGHTIFNMLKNMTGSTEAEILKVITPDMVPMIGRNDPSERYAYYRNAAVAETWDSDQQVSWGNALKWIQTWLGQAQTWATVDKISAPLLKADTPPIVDQVRSTPFPPLTQAEIEKIGGVKMVDLLTRTHNWNEQNKYRKIYTRMKYKQLKDKFLTTPGRNYPLYGKNKTQREALITTHLNQNESGRKRDFYQELWTKSKGGIDPAVLLMIGKANPTYYMAWIIAKTYHMNNPEVKNVAGYEGRYKYRNWELKERYYPTIGKGDTLPKTTANWPRYSAAPPILNDFTMQEIANSLKTNFRGVLQAKKDKDKAVIEDAVKKHEQTKQQYLNNAGNTLRQILQQGIVEWNRTHLANAAFYYTKKRHKRKALPANKIASISYDDIKAKLGPSAFKAAIKDYENKQKNIRDSTIATATDNYTKAMTNVGEAKGSKTKSGTT